LKLPCLGYDGESVERGPIVKAGKKNLFKGRQFTTEIILWAVRWYLQFLISYRDLERIFSDRGIQVDHTTLFRWIQAYAPELEKRIRPHLRMTNGSWRVDETYIRVNGEWVCVDAPLNARKIITRDLGTAIGC
jgi:transposase-like protein